LKKGTINDAKLALNNQSCGVSRALKNNEPTKQQNKPPLSIYRHSTRKKERIININIEREKRKK